MKPDRAAKNGVDSGRIGGFHNQIEFDYSAEGFTRQLESSLQRIGLGYIDSLVIHDLEPYFRRRADDNGLGSARRDLGILQESGFACLQKMRSDGTIGAFGAGTLADSIGTDLPRFPCL